ncbi:hypothetical protein HO173_003325 [Letharia columbiana]|uniref:Uncharacterized protein n=1 Tax=Letharia columbiana TaxID=112416 RepID=A0A8H6G1J2_9LECA|nr:uncharacterized protein HO173_003325 [Letharia columbiana]KAF6238818.1 hypothetical protein HO173_003325 [Letharia columbiana]
MDEDKVNDAQETDKLLSKSDGNAAAPSSSLDNSSGSTELDFPYPVTLSCGFMNTNFFRDNLDWLDKAVN